MQEEEAEERGKKELPVEILLICLSDNANLTWFWSSAKISLVVGRMASTGKGNDRHFVSTPSNIIPPGNGVGSVVAANSANFSAFIRC